MSTLSTSSLRPLYKAAQVRELDRRTIASGIDSFALMQRAASSAWHSFRSRWPQARSVTVLCGSGNNGGDGHVLAALAMQAGLKVQRLSSKPLAALTGDVAKAAEQIPVARTGTPEDIAAAASFFARQEASFISGQVLYVAGGPKA